MKFPKPEHLSTKDNDRELFYMKATQFPIISTDATTGHKLQGCSVKDLFVLNWSLLQNWTYVMLSRVETKAGFFTGRSDPEVSKKSKRNATKNADVVRPL